MYLECLFSNKIIIIKSLFIGSNFGLGIILYNKYYMSNINYIISSSYNNPNMNL